MNDLYDRDCPFCPFNHKVKIMAETTHAYLIARTDRGVVLPGQYLINPRAHFVDVWELLEQPWWGVELAALLRQVPGIKTANFNLSTNCGKKAGQTLPHLHEWVVLRDGEEGLPSEGLGLATLINHFNAPVR